MSATPLLDRIKERRPKPQPLLERMGPFARRLAQKQLAPKDTTRLWLHDGCGPDGTAA